MNARFSHLKRAYSEIVRGYSLTKINSELVYVKHTSAVDSAELEFKYEEFFQEAKFYEIPTIAEKELYLISTGLWSEKKNTEILTWQEFIKSLNITKTKVLIKADIDSINEQIKDGEKTLLELQIEKNNLLGHTAESYAYQKFNDLIVCESMFKDAELKEKYLDSSSFNDLDNTQIENLVDCYRSIISGLGEATLKKIAVQPFFQNSFGLCDKDIYKYYGKPIIDLTVFQINLFSLGVYYKEILREYGGEVTEDIINDPDSFVERVVQKRNINKVLDSSDASGQSIVGMTVEDMKRAGISQGEIGSMSKFVGKSFEEIAQVF